MSEPKGASSDPSMDDILASIRKIISDDEARAQVTGQQFTPLQAESQQAATRPGASAPEAKRSESPAAGHDDVLLLTDLIEPSAAQGASAIPIRLPRIDRPKAADLPQTTFTLAAKPVATSAIAVSAITTSAVALNPAALNPVALNPVAKAETTVGPTLVGGTTSESTALAFARLNQAVLDSVPAPAAHDPGPRIDGNGKTVEDLVKEMLRPMLQEWLDRNLPPMVERYVEGEIVRLTRR
ncbi:PopZ family protein [soil metagenome]